MTVQLGFGEQTWPDVYLPLLINYLGVQQRVAKLSADRVFLSVWDDNFHLEFPVADRFVAVSQPNFPVDQREVLGGGAINTAFDSELQLRVFCRVESDPEGKSVNLMTEQSINVLTFLNQVLTATQMWPGPIAAVSGRSMLRRPLRIAPGFTIEPKTGKGNTRWALARMRFELSFVSNLGQNYPGG